MRNLTWAYCALCLLWVVGCDQRAVVPDVDNIPAEVAGGFNTSGMARPPNREQVTPWVNVTFVGRHKGDEPKPRYITVMDVGGQMKMPGGEFSALESIKLGFYMNMLSVDAAASGLSNEEAMKLKQHLEGTDFFNIKQHSTATFDSTLIKVNDDGTGTITGKLTLMDQTQEMTIPFTVPEDKVIEATFKIDRTKFGMNYGLDQIEEEVEVRIKLDGSKG